MTIVNKQTAIAMLEESVRSLTDRINFAKTEDGSIYSLQEALLDFQTSVAELDPSFELIEYKLGHIESNEIIWKILNEKGIDILESI